MIDLYYLRIIMYYPHITLRLGYDRLLPAMIGEN
jgi:hypothetical protein